MGKRKTRKAQAGASALKRARTALPSRFECPFCNMHQTVLCTLKPDQGRANVACEQCGMRYDTSCKTLTEPVDVYHEWLDACEEAVREPATTATTRHLDLLDEGQGAERPPSGRPLRRAAAPAAAAAHVVPLHRAGVDDRGGGVAAGDAHHGDGDGDGGQPATAAGASRLRLSPPSHLHRLRRGPQDAGGGGGGGGDLPGSPPPKGAPVSPRSPRALVASAGRRRTQLVEGLEHTMREGLKAGAALHDPAAASLLAERTGLGGAAASGALPAGSGPLQQMALRQHVQRHHHHHHEEEEDVVDGGEGEIGAAGAGAPPPSPAPRRSADGGVAAPHDGGPGGGGPGGGAGASGTTPRRTTEQQRQQQAVRAFGEYDD